MKKTLLQILGSALFLATVMVACDDHVIETPVNDPDSFNVTQTVSDLRAPLGVTLDDKGNAWVTEVGTGDDDAAVVMISPDGTKTTFAIGFSSAGGPEGVEGISHLLYHEGKLYILHGIDGKLFIADVAGFKAGDTPRDISSFSVQEYGTFVKSFGLTTPLNSNLYDLTLGPDGDLYMVDAGANAIFRREKATGKLFLFTALPKVGSAPFIVDAVPTGIVFDGTRFLVSTLSGGPFIAGAAKIYAVTPDGVVSHYNDKGFTTLTGITLSPKNKPLVLKFADFPLPPTGFTPNTGGIFAADGTLIHGGLNMPTDLKRVSPKDYLVVSMGDGKLFKLTQKNP